MCVLGLNCGYVPWGLLVLVLSLGWVALFSCCFSWLLRLCLLVVGLAAFVVSLIKVWVGFEVLMFCLAALCALCVDVWVCLFVW